MAFRSCLGLSQRASQCSRRHGIHRQFLLWLPVPLCHPVNVTISPRSAQYFATKAKGKGKTKKRAASSKIFPPLLGPPEPPHATLTINGHNLESFPIGVKNDFSFIRQSQGLAYFDRTGYISVLNSVPWETLLLLRPPAFGKSLTISMLEYFHGVQYKDKYDAIFKGLDVDKDVKSGLVVPGEYMILRFDFSGIERNPDLNATARKFASVIVDGLKDFYTQYHSYWGVPAGKLVFDKVNIENPVNSLRQLVKLVNETLSKVQENGDESHPLASVKGIYLLADEHDAFTNRFLDSWSSTNSPALVRTFWTHVKDSMNLKFGIRRCFITGTTPLSLDDTRGFKLAKDVSLHKELAGLCGLTFPDVEAALAKICDSEVETKKHLSELTKYTDGYHFCSDNRVANVYSTVTCLEYLQAALKKTPTQIHDPPNSEVSKSLLRFCASSPIAMRDIQNALTTKVEPSSMQEPMSYQSLDTGLLPHDLYSISGQNEFSWRKFMLYHGGLTFDSVDPDKLLKIPNRIAAQRFGDTILDRWGLRDSIGDAVSSIESHGDIKKALTCYRKLISQRDNEFSVYDWEEEKHRDSFHISVLSNPALVPKPGYKVTLPETVQRAGNNPRVDLLVTTPKHLIFTHWESIGIDSLDVVMMGTRPKKLKALSEVTVEQLLDLRFSSFWHGRMYTKRIKKEVTIEEWIETQVSRWMAGYVRQRKIAMCGDRKFLAYLVLVVGSRQILVWDLDENGSRTDVRMLV